MPSWCHSAVLMLSHSNWPACCDIHDVILYCWLVKVSLLITKRGSWHLGKWWRWAFSTFMINRPTFLDCDWNGVRLMVSNIGSALSWAEGSALSLAYKYCKWLMKANGGSWYIMEAHDGSWWTIVVNGGSWRILVAQDGSECLIWAHLSAVLRANLSAELIYIAGGSW